ncbi:MAG: DNA topoisomerase [Agitococcus sp.]|nr:DNA topoisomerase [Agitococcus sp.]MDO9176992.1 DNA topoisomerase [Agitococcus sp.]
MATGNTKQKEDKEPPLPDVSDGEMAEVLTVAIQEKKTRPPANYTEGSLIADMKGAAKFVENDPVLRDILKELSGLGTSATRDNIIETLKHHKYLEKSGKHIVATDKGIRFIMWIDQVLPEIADVSVTARWEAELAVVAKKGGGQEFEDRVAQKVRDMIAIFKTAPSMGQSSTSKNNLKESTSMSESDNKSASTPSDKMLEFAKNIATKVNLRVPDDVMTNWDACKAFIDEHKDTAMRPSDKQLNFATKIASDKKLTIPPETLKNGRDLSKWIDDNKA